MLATLLLCSPRAGVLAGTATIRSRWAPVIKLCEASVQRASSPRARPPRPTPSQRPEEARRASHPTYLIRQAGQLRDSTRLLLPPRCGSRRQCRVECCSGRTPSASSTPGSRWATTASWSKAAGRSRCPRHERRRRSRSGRRDASELKAGRRRHHWCSACVDRRDDLLDVDPLQVDAGRAEV
jgi:hypothetical protein